MFFGQKKRDAQNRGEFIKVLQDFAGITEQEATDYYEKNKGFITQSYRRGLDTFGAVWHIANASMEKICAAHDIGELHHIEEIPDYMLLVSLQVVNAMKGKVSEEELNSNNRYWNAVIKMKIDPQASDRTYGDLLHELVDEYNAKQ